MEEDIEAAFKGIMAHNHIELDLPEQQVLVFSIQELAEVLESLNVASAVVAQNLFEALEDRDSFEFPEEAVHLIRALRPMAEALTHVLSDECTCEVEDEEEDDE